VPLSEEIPLYSDAIKERYALRYRYFTAVNSSKVRTLADRHRHAAYHNKHCWRAFRGVPTSMT